MRSLQLIGPKGLLTSHALFEGGAFTIMAPLRLRNALPTAEDIAEIREFGVVGYFHRVAREVAVHEMYKRYMDRGWTQKLSRDIRRELAPRMVRMVTLAWYAALCDAGLVPEPA